MRNVYDYINLRLAQLIGLYLGLFVVYTSLPADLSLVRQLLSIIMLVVMFAAILSALGTFKANDR